MDGNTKKKKIKKTKCGLEYYSFLYRLINFRIKYWIYPKINNVIKKKKIDNRMISIGCWKRLIGYK